MFAEIMFTCNAVPYAVIRDENDEVVVSQVLDDSKDLDEQLAEVQLAAEIAAGKYDPPDEWPRNKYPLEPSWNYEDGWTV
jgi:uncharacterized protein YfcZ (UPF0381/DUF406 family)